MTVRVKICGINSAGACRAAIEAGADWIGFVFHPTSPRAVSCDAASRIIAESGANGASPRRVGLFTSDDRTAMRAAVTALRLDVLQLYLPAETCREIRSELGIAVWRAIGVAARDDLPADDEGLDGFIIESKPPPGADRPGGHAKRIDWSITRGWTAPAPWLLAGGLDPDNVAAAIAESGAIAVDVSSGVETAPGVKSPDLIRAFIEAAKAG